jgi:hypothetical protein
MVNDRFRKNSVFTGVLTQAVGPNGQIKLTFGRYNSEFEQKRKDYDDRDGDGDHDEYLVFRKVLVRDGEPGTSAYQDTLLYRYTTEDEELAYIWTHDPTWSDSINFPNTYDPTYPGQWKFGNPDLLADSHLAKTFLSQSITGRLRLGPTIPSGCSSPVIASSRKPALRMMTWMREF